MVVHEYTFVLPSCPVREGSGHTCSWYVTGCIHPEIPDILCKHTTCGTFAEVKQLCHGSLPRTPKEIVT